MQCDAYTFVIGKPQGKSHLVDQGVDGRDENKS
jgi:hypothetical protein